MSHTLKCVLVCLVALVVSAGGPALRTVQAEGESVSVPIVFVARAHLATPDDIFSDELGPAGQFGTGIPKFAPGSKLMVREPNGTLRTLVDGSAPTAAKGFLIDVQSPDVSFDGTRIVFAGATTVDPESSQYGWRLYEIRVDGTNFRKLPIPDRNFISIPNANPNGYDFGNAATYGWWNDLFPAYLADGRIVFASSRAPARAHYDGRRTYNLYVVNGDGTSLRRITSERGGFLHPTPLPDGRILTTRWWNNFNQPSATGIFNRIDNRPTDTVLPDGTVIRANADATFNPPVGELPGGFEIRGGPNTWHLMALNPDGTDLERFAFTPYGDYALTDDSGMDTYTAAQPSVVFVNNELLIAYTSQQDSTMVHSTQRTGIRVARPGVDALYANSGDAIAGLTYARAWGNGDESPPYAIHPWGLPDGRLLFSYTESPNPALPSSGSYTDRVTGRQFTLQGSQLQYQLHTMQIDGSARTALPMSIGSADAMDAKPIVARTGWTTRADLFTAIPSDDPRQGNLPNTLAEYAFSQRGPAQIATATIRNPNIYANAPLTLPFINNSPMPGTITRAQVYVDANQFTGSYCYDNYPNPCASFRPDDQLRAVLWTEVPVTLGGAFTATVPADTPGFIVLRDAQGRVANGWNRGHISIAQGNAWARPGETVTCVGCHLGHVSGSIPTSQRPMAEQGWTNIAPYASASASSHRPGDDPGYEPFTPDHINDRRGWVPALPATPSRSYQDETTGWLTPEGRTVGEWVELRWPSPVLVRQVRLVGPPSLGGDWDGFGKAETSSPYWINGGALRFFEGGTEVGTAVAVGRVEPLAAGGTLITLPQPRRIDRLRFTVGAVTGKWWWQDVAALNEIEVIGQAAVPVCNLPYDWNGGGVVDLSDMMWTASGWRQSIAANDVRDINRNGRVDISDIMVVARAWESRCS